MIECNNGFNYEFSLDDLTNMGKEDDTINTCMSFVCSKREKEIGHFVPDKRVSLNIQKCIFTHAHQNQLP